MNPAAGGKRLVVTIRAAVHIDAKVIDPSIDPETMCIPNDDSGLLRASLAEEIRLLQAGQPLTHLGGGMGGPHRRIATYPAGSGVEALIRWWEAAAEGPEGHGYVELDLDGVDFEFCCPRCGSSYYSTDTIEDTGYCRGYDDGAGGCGFEWPRSEDARYFHLRLSVP